VGAHTRVLRVEVSIFPRFAWCPSYEISVFYFLISIFRFPHFILPNHGFSTPYRSIRTIPTLYVTSSVYFAILSRVFGTKFSPARSSPARIRFLFFPSSTF
jgi:hypothetical protein